MYYVYKKLGINVYVQHLYQYCGKSNGYYRPRHHTSLIWILMCRECVTIKVKGREVLEFKKSPGIKKYPKHLVDYQMFNSTDDTNLIVALSAGYL